MSARHWDDVMRLAGSLKLGRVPASGIMGTVQIGDQPTRLAQALAEFGRIDKSRHSLAYLDNESRRRATLLQMNRGEGRPSLAAGQGSGASAAPEKEAGASKPRSPLSPPSAGWDVY